MRKFLLLLLALFVLVAAVVLYRTWRFEAPPVPPELEGISVEAQPEVLQRALQVQSISHKAEMIDSMAFLQLHQIIREGFPLIDSLLERSVVGNYSLLYRWRGTGKKAPVVLMGHLDVVPVEYASRLEWEAEPFGGEILNEYVYGRGALDDKGSVFALLDAVENLLRQNHQPERDLYFCFGHDEEIGGEDGAVAIVDLLESQGIRPAMVLDEGGLVAEGLVPGIQAPVALIGLSEKGYLSVQLSANVAGGHSSMPGEVTAISTLLEALRRLEENPMPNRLSEPLEGFVQHIGPHLPFAQRMAFANRWLFESLIFQAYNSSNSSAALVRTTQAFTILQSGIKDNLVPGRATAVVNYRLLPGDEPEEILQRMREIIGELPIQLSVYEDLAIPASAVSPYKDSAFRYLQSAIHSTFPEALSTPYLVLGATDGRHFYRICDRVYRFLPFRFEQEDIARLHGVNERVALKNYSEAVEFYATFIGNLNTYSDGETVQ